MRVGRGLLLLLFFCLLSVLPSSGTVEQIASASVDKPGSPFSQPARVGERFLDLRNYLFRIAERHGWSVVVAQDVNSNVKEVHGKTVADALKAYLHGSEFSYRLYDNVLYVADNRRLKKFFEELPADTMMLPKGKNEVTISGIFQGIDIAILFKMLRGLTGIEIRSSDDLRATLMLRLIKMPWKTLVVAIVRLNDYKLIRSEFSVLVAKQ